MNINYNDSSQTILFKFPQNWIDSRSSITSVSIQISDRSGNSLLASTAMTLSAKTTLNGAVTSGDNQIITDADLILNRDYLLSDTSQEIIHINTFDSSSKVSDLEDNLYHDYGDEADVYPLFATYDLDSSDTDTFLSGEEILITFVNNLGDAYRETGNIIEQVYSIKGFQREFQILYPNEYRQIEEHFDEYASLSERRLRARLRSKGINLDKTYEHDLYDDLFSSYMRLSILESGGDNDSHEYEVAKNVYNEIEINALSIASWVDVDQDQVEEISEVDRRIPRFFARGLF